MRTGFMVADDDESGALDEREFQMLIGYLLYFNDNRHQVDELHAYFKDGFDSDGFYTACMVMGEPMGDDDAEEARHGAAEVIGLGADRVRSYCRLSELNLCPYRRSSTSGGSATSTTRHSPRRHCHFYRT